MIELADHGWGRSESRFPHAFTSRFIPGGTSEQLDWFNELTKTTPHNAARLRLAAKSTSKPWAVRTPTLVIHARSDEVIPLLRPDPGDRDSGRAIRRFRESHPPGRRAAWGRFREASSTSPARRGAE